MSNIGGCTNQPTYMCKHLHKPMTKLTKSRARPHTHTPIHSRTIAGLEIDQPRCVMMLLKLAKSLTPTASASREKHCNNDRGMSFLPQTTNNDKPKAAIHCILTVPIPQYQTFATHYDFMYGTGWYTPPADTILGLLQTSCIISIQKV